MNTLQGRTQHDLSPRFSSLSPPVWATLVLFLGIAFCSGCAPKTPHTTDDLVLRTCSPDKLFASKHHNNKNQLTVTAMAYTAQSCGHRKHSHPRAANGECLTPQMNAIAVSPDLIQDYGIRLNKTVHLQGLKGDYTVKDIMNARHKKSIDIYFGDNQAAARQWGRRTLTLSWE